MKNILKFKAKLPSIAEMILLAVVLVIISFKFRESTPRENKYPVGDFPPYQSEPNLKDYYDYDYYGQ